LKKKETKIERKKVFEKLSLEERCFGSNLNHGINRKRKTRKKYHLGYNKNRRKSER